MEKSFLCVLCFHLFKESFEFLTKVGQVIDHVGANTGKGRSCSLLLSLTSILCKDCDRFKKFMFQLWVAIYGSCRITQQTES